MMILRDRSLFQCYFIVLVFLSAILLFLLSCNYSCSNWRSAEEESAKDEKVLDDLHKAPETAAFTKAVKDSVSRSISDSVNSLQREMENQTTDKESLEELEQIEKPKTKKLEKPKVKAVSAQKTHKPSLEETLKKTPVEQPAKEIQEKPKRITEKKFKSTGAPGVATASSPGNTYLLQGHTAFKNKSYREATKYLKKAVQADLNLFLAHYWLGRAYIERGRHYPAVQALENALATRSEEDEDIDVEKYLAWEYVEAEQYEKAVDLYRQRVKANPENLEDRFGLAFALKGTGKLQEAAQAYRKAIEIDPDIASIHFNLANTLAEMNSIKEAVEEYRAAIALKPGYGKAYFNLGMALEKDAKQEEAIKAFNKCIELGHNTWQAKRRIKAILKEGE